MENAKAVSAEGFSTLALSQCHLIKFKKFCKQQRLEQKTILEYLIDYAIFHDINIHLPIPKNKLFRSVSIRDLNDLKENLINEWIRFSRHLSPQKPDQDDEIKSLESRYNKQLKEQMLKISELQYILDQFTGQKK